MSWRANAAAFLSRTEGKQFRRVDSTYPVARGDGLETAQIFFLRMPIVTGNLQDLVSAPIAGALLSFQSNTRATNSALALANPVSVVSGANGRFSTPNLLFGVYSLRISWDRHTEKVAGQFVERYNRNANFALTIPDVGGPLDIIALLNLNSPPPPTAGYSKTQVDALLAALVAGGDGAPTGTPSGTRLYWDRTNGALYIGDDGAWTQLLAL